MKQKEANPAGRPGKGGRPNPIGEHLAKARPPGPRQPFLSVWQAAALLDCAEMRVYHYIQEGRLPLAFDISRPGCGRLCIRLAAASVLALQRRGRPPEDLNGFVARVLPESHFSYRAPQLARMLQCDVDHIYHLIAARALEDVGGSTRYRVPRHSFVRFLAERRVT
jgi:hypothetical protein